MDREALMQKGLQLGHFHNHGHSIKSSLMFLYKWLAKQQFPQFSFSSSNNSTFFQWNSLPFCQPSLDVQWLTRIFSYCAMIVKVDYKQGMAKNLIKPLCNIISYK